MDDSEWPELPLDEDGDPVDLKTEEHRDEWIDFLIEQDDEWVNECIVVHDGDNLVMRVRWPDGKEVIFDCEIRRAMQVVQAEDDRGNN